MRKIIISTLIISIFLIASCIAIYYKCSKIHADLAIVIIQSALSGAFTSFVTFGGLFLTFRKQNEQNKLLNESEICPCLIIEANADVFPSGKELINDNEVRKLNCIVYNARKNNVLNASLHIGEHSENVVPINHGAKYETTLNLISEGIHEVHFSFENIYGQHYFQKVEYEYQKELNKYVFTHSQPIKLTEENNGKNSHKRNSK